MSALLSLLFGFELAFLLTLCNRPCFLSHLFLFIKNSRGGPVQQLDRQYRNSAYGGDLHRVGRCRCPGRKIRRSCTIESAEALRGGASTIALENFLEILQKEKKTVPSYYVTPLPLYMEITPFDRNPILPHAIGLLAPGAKQRSFYI